MREAADILGVSKEAVRKRVIRGTLRSDTGEDGRRYVYLDTDTDESPTHERHVLISQLREEIEYLREESRRKDHIIAGLVERIPPALEAPQEPPSEPPGAPETAESPGPSPTPTEGSGAQEEGTGRPWWRRLFGG
jgi:hypothetical protein